ncbi:DET1 [Chionoecetes opilio]|uniref:DET1 n=1 Tax=Chionoecetes opilio TaxID=41210 RepID=A0A8J8WN24_CHIOP|nr:DET1 [Chionoecetes opilio]
MYRNNESVTPNPRSPLEDYTLHIVDIEMGRLSDSRTFMHDKIFLSHNQGLYLYRHTLAVLSVQHQTIHIFQITPDGYFFGRAHHRRVCSRRRLPAGHRVAQTACSAPTTTCARRSSTRSNTGCWWFCSCL